MKPVIFFTFIAGLATPFVSAKSYCRSFHNTGTMEQDGTTCNAKSNCPFPSSASGQPGFNFPLANKAGAACSVDFKCCY
ncbi:uncharacterized protein PgNI_07697 [Pyricularia grisea]|uniref:Uncharacterized protein n=1 Tax=Pyricularia grisea TaxID=148305 RepID=A0A6P8B382_PYRGI|nr:uncharacterized protein PgNI_07697 [Pyricularia grisea]TLD09312.1 hypothetical protein PgNI_07697 [Pyricularia grisea]